MNKKQKTILLVDDESIPALADSLKLKEYGYKVIHVLTGQKAIDIVNDGKNMIDLILMDINLGKGMDGTEVAKIILKEYDIPLLFHSSHIERDVVERTENITSYGYVVKNGITVLDASIKMAFRLHEAYLEVKNHKKEMVAKENEIQVFEKRYQRLFEAAKDGILILHAESGKIIDVNPFLINMLGYSKEQFLEKNIWDISAFKNMDYSKNLYKELQDKEYVRYDDLPLETTDGRTVHVEFVSNVYSVDGEKVIQCNIRDITDRIKYEKDLTDNIDEKEALLREIQHRTKNSFSLITSLIQLRSGRTHSEETKKTLEELVLRVRSISDLYSLLHETDSFSEVHIKQYFKKIIGSMLNLSNNITIKKNIEEITLPTKSAATIGMILVELLSNAIKYAFPDSLKGIINIVLKRENTCIKLIVEDNGIGLQNDFDIANIKSLGLQLVNLMVSQLDGKIEILTNNGTKISIKIPFE